MNNKKSIRNFVREVMRYGIDYRNRKRLMNKNFTIFCSNCVGGVIYNSLGVRFDSPTINMFFMPKDFLKFLRNPDFYLNGRLSLVESENRGYPVVACEDILLFCVHYNSFDEVKEKWTERGKRVNWNNIYIIMSERDGCTEDDIVAFEELPYKNKVIFVSKDMPQITSAVFIEGTGINKNGQGIIPLTEYMSKFSGMRYIDKFDYVNFINKGLF